MGHKADADQLAMHLLSRSQGIATLANAFDDAAFIKQEVDQLLEWLNAYLKPHQPQGVPSDVHRPA
jgi:TetR/AcrR family transcriptional repressor of nem operon